MTSFEWFYEPNIPKEGIMLEGQNTEQIYQNHCTKAHKHARIKSRYNGETEKKGLPTQSNYL
jgi:metal-dependent hydrolase (beta-lactamase superfamily II)